MATIKSTQKKAARQLLKKTEANKRNMDVLKLQEIANPLTKTSREDVWIIADSSSSFTNLNLENG